MKRLLAITICVLMFALCACQPTPEEEYVVNKGDNKAEEIINHTALPIPNTDAPTGNEPEPTQVDMTSDWQDAAAQPVFPEKWEDLIDCPDKQIIIEADVISGDMSAYPVHLIARHSFTAEDIKKVGRVLFPDAVGWGNSRAMSKEEITNAMAEIVADDELDDETREAQLALLQAELDGSNAVDEPTINAVSGFEEVPDVFVADCSVKLDDGMGRVYSYRNGVLLSRFKDGGTGFEMEMDPDSIPIEPELELDEAIAYAEAFLREAGLSGFELSSSKHERMFDMYTLHDISTGWNLKYIRTFGYNSFDANAMDIGEGYLFNFGDDMKFIAKWEVERIELYVDREGVVTFSWSDPVEDVGVVNENVQLMDFDTLSETVVRMLTAAVKNPYWDEGYFKLEECILT
ncbi:MAG: hypothetical protein J6P98_03450, partial [Clostridia bacterium]|nr:hypothetical protein [Clostridia bacterium]